MAKNCIICGARAGSGEHIFPAAFGGRRTNKGIYCGKHNQAFGRHVSELLSSLDIVNAAIGVIPDRHDRVRPAPVTSAEGERFLVAKGSLKLAPPLPLRETPDLVGKANVMPFADMAQAAQWIADQERDGFVLEVGKPGNFQSKILTEPLQIQRTLGSEPFMRSLVYLALTFLAHYFPAEARAPGLASARDIVEKDAPVGERVWWEPPAVIDQLKQNPFSHGHTVAIAVDGDTKKTTALISMYGAIRLGIDLGETSRADVSRVTTHINPLAESAPHDIEEIREAGNSLTLGSPEQGLRYIKDVQSGQVEHPFGETFEKVGREDIQAISEQLLPELLKTKSLSRDERVDQIAAIMASQDQRIFNLLREGIVRFEREASDVPAQIHEALKLMIASDKTSIREISSTTSAALLVSTAVVRDEVRKLVESDSLDVASLGGILAGPEGLGIVFKAVVTPLLTGFFRAAKEAKSSSQTG